LADLESNGIYVNAECFNKHFDAKVNPNGLVYSQYNVYTSTGRPSNHFDNVNYAALNKDDGVRSCFVSRYGDKGFMMLVDYSAFHPRIICNLVNFPLSIDEDIYKYLGEMYLKRKVTEYDMEEIKSVTMRQLYGGVEEKYEGIKYFASLKEFMNDNWNFFKNNGYVLTPMFKRKITDKHLHDPNPAKLFNYILQATESEVAISALRWINNYLIGKKTKAVLYTYDSILFDFYKPDGHEVVGNIMELMMVAKKFPIKVYMGLSYNSVSQIYP
jgi:DNA polymerase I-like protein with 3'-5' exonuclease and polymerase domains